MYKKIISYYTPKNHKRKKLILIAVNFNYSSHKNNYIMIKKAAKNNHEEIADIKKFDEYVRHGKIKQIRECLDDRIIINSQHIETLMAYFNEYYKKYKCKHWSGEGFYYQNYHDYPRYNVKNDINDAFFEGKLKRYIREAKQNVFDILDMFVDYGYLFTENDIILLGKNCFDLSPYIDVKNTITKNIIKRMQDDCDKYEFYPYNIEMSLDRFKLKMGLCNDPLYYQKQPYSNRELYKYCEILFDNVKELEKYAKKFNYKLTIKDLEWLCKAHVKLPIIKYFVTKLKINPNLQCFRYYCKSKGSYQILKYFINNCKILPDINDLNDVIRIGERAAISIVFEGFKKYYNEQMGIENDNIKNNNYQDNNNDISDDDKDTKKKSKKKKDIEKDDKEPKKKKINKKKDEDIEKNDKETKKKKISKKKDKDIEEDDKETKKKKINKKSEISKIEK